VILGLIACAFSGAIFYLEVTTFLEWGIFDYSEYIESDVTFWQCQILALIPLLYISFCVYVALFRIKIFNFYGLYPNQQTETASMVFNA